MPTIQLAINDTSYARWIRTLLLRDDAHRVYITKWPELQLEGVVVTDKEKFQKLFPARKEVRRFLVITPNDYKSLRKLWNAGIRHVIFEGDSPGTAVLAILSVELNLFQRGQALAYGRLH